MSILVNCLTLCSRIVAPKSWPDFKQNSNRILVLTRQFTIAGMSKAENLITLNYIPITICVCVCVQRFSQKIKRLIQYSSFAYAHKNEDESITFLSHIRWNFRPINAMLNTAWIPRKFPIGLIYIICHQFMGTNKISKFGWNVPVNTYRISDILQLRLKCTYMIFQETWK